MDGNEKFIYIIVGFASITLIAVSHINPAEYPELSFFVKELGFAGIIALIIIFTLEKFIREKHIFAAQNLIEKINLDLFHAIYTKHVPEKVFHEVEKCLLKSDVYRKDHEINYTLQRVSGSEDKIDAPNHLMCLAQSSYKLVNTTSGPITHNVVLNLEKPIDRAWDGKTKILEIKIDGERLPQEIIIKHTKTTGEQIKFEYPVSIPENRNIHVSSSSVLIKREVDSELWVSRLPSDGLKLTVSVPIPNIEVNAISNHSESLEITLDNPVTKKWELNYGIFPFQSVIFWWWKEE